MKNSALIPLIGLTAGLLSACDSSDSSTGISPQSMSDALHSVMEADTNGVYEVDCQSFAERGKSNQGQLALVG